MTDMDLAVVIGIVATIVCVTAMVKAWCDEEVDIVEALMIGIAVTLLVACAVMLYNEEKTEDYTQDCVCSCECCGRSKTE